MRKFLCGLATGCLLAGLLAAPAMAATEEWEFSDISRIKIDGVSGDVILLPAKGSSGRVVLESNVRPAENFKADVDQHGQTLRIKEKFRGRGTSGKIEWTVYLPQRGKPIRVSINNASGDLDCSDASVLIDYNTASGETRLSQVELAEGSRFDTASGDYTFEDLTLTEDISFSTASGDYVLRNLEIGADCEFSTASGDIRIIDCRCADGVEFSTASGDVIVKNSDLKGQADFSSASGDVSVYLKAIPADDLSASSASGNVTLGIEDFGGDCTLVLIKREDRGRITCPFEYDEEETFEDYHHTYEKKTVRIGRGGPELKLRTASGKVKVKK